MPAAALAAEGAQVHINTDGVYTKGTRAYMQKELIIGGGLERASEGQEPLWQSVLNARRIYIECI